EKPIVKDRPDCPNLPVWSTCHAHRQRRPAVSLASFATQLDYRGTGCPRYRRIWPVRAGPRRAVQSAGAAADPRRPAIPPDPLGLLARAPDRLDRQRRHARLLRDRAVLVHDEGPGRLVLVQAAEQLARHLAVGALAAILIDNVEQHEL